MLTRTAGGLRLKHDHRHADGKPDAVTMYGGDATDPGSPTRQAFPVDAESIAMFRREGLEIDILAVEGSVSVGKSVHRGAELPARSPGVKHG